MIFTLFEIKLLKFREGLSKPNILEYDNSNHVIYRIFCDL